MRSQHQLNQPSSKFHGSNSTSVKSEQWTTFQSLQPCSSIWFNSQPSEFYIQDVNSIPTISLRGNTVPLSRVRYLVSHHSISNRLSLILLCRAYSAHEFSTLSTRPDHQAALPLDIKLETLISVLLACTGLVLSSDPLKPISWSTWAGNIEKDGAVNPFDGLEDRAGFMDIRVSPDEKKYNLNYSKVLAF